MKNIDSAILRLAFGPTTFICKQTIDKLKKNSKLLLLEDDNFVRNTN